MDFWPSFLATLTSIVLNVLLISDWIDEHKKCDEPDRIDEPEKDDESSE